MLKDQRVVKDSRETYQWLPEQEEFLPALWDGLKDSFYKGNLAEVLKIFRAEENLNSIREVYSRGMFRAFESYDKDYPINGLENKSLNEAWNRLLFPERGLLPALLVQLFSVGFIPRVHQLFILRDNSTGGVKEGIWVEIYAPDRGDISPFIHNLISEVVVPTPYFYFSISELYRDPVSFWLILPKTKLDQVNFSISRLLRAFTPVEVIFDWVFDIGERPEPVLGYYMDSELTISSRTTSWLPGVHSALGEDLGP